MQNVFESCYPLDKHAYEAYGLTEDILMEHAAGGMAAYIRSHFPAGTSILIAAGAGNNGADGIVLARQLMGSYEIRLYLPFGVKSEMAKRQLERAKAVGVPIVEEIEGADVVVDALFGAGLTRRLDEKAQQLIHKLNALDGDKIACDIPTGIAQNGQLMPIAFRADVTITMGAYKEALFLDESKDYVGRIIRVDLGIDASRYELESQTLLLEQNDLRLPSRHRQCTNKGTFGHAAVFCGEKEGAGIIAATAASRFGAGLTTLVVHEKVTPPPFLMHSAEVPKSASALAVGMGLGNYFDEIFLKKEVIGSSLPVVLDADAFYSESLLEILEQKAREVVITPHPKEFSVLWRKLTGEKLSVKQVQEHRFDMVRRFNAKYPHVTLLLKGANMLIAQEDRLYINPLGSPVLSKGGSGDVLSGLIVSLLAQGHTGLNAAIQGSLALTAAAASYRGASYALLPTDLIDALAMLEQK